MIGLDTTFLIDFFKEDKGALELLQKTDALFICEPVIFEFLCGNISEKAERTLHSFLSQLQSFPVDRDAAKRASKVYRDGKRSGKAVGGFDALIAGTYLANGIQKIATRNVKHFGPVDDIEPVTY